MTAPASALGAAALARVTIVVSGRRMDVALPEDVPVAELLPYILRHAGDDAADAGERHGGWMLRRPTGDDVDTRQTLAAQKVLDGEVLHLVPGQLEWPELEYDDVIESIASGARRYGRSWGRAATRRCGLAACAGVLLAGTLVTLLFEPPWLVPGLVLYGMAVVLVALGAVIARALPDATAGAVLAGCGLPYAFLGGLLLTGPEHAAPAGFGAPQLLLASVSLLVFGIAGYLGVAALPRIFVAAATAGLIGAFGAALGGSMEPDGAAALVLTVGIGALPGYPLLAIRLGRLPLPVLPQRPADLLDDAPSPKPPVVFAAAARSDEVLSGLLLGLSVVAVTAGSYLAVHGEATRLGMLAAVTVALLLRARLFAVPRQRIPLLVAGTVVGALLAVAFSAGFDDSAWVLLLLVTAVVAALAAFAALVYSNRNPSPYLGRIADIVDVLAVLALIPLACSITGFYAFVRGAAAGIG
ncbi:type VII secretion integral membrane protein EccD [Qaidamihabitans albus]|uniref:type VII secretion integral membrane protein EccD n=1 Tax=Qaidamihabitans albus TaxID=2795733 RepID=UPI0018F1D86A|nr:type VII secretion integral membrane protein EccD [Qaidamihabitans albus]